MNGLIITNLRLSLELCRLALNFLVKYSEQTVQTYDGRPILNIDNETFLKLF